MLAFGHIDKNTPYYQMANADLVSICFKVIQSFEIRLEKKEIDWTYYIPKTPLWIHADAHHIENVIHNLQDNALKYSMPKNAQISLKNKKKKNEILLEINDSGIGIAKQYQQKIFERFFRITEENMHNLIGYGMGLSYVKKVLDAHNYSLELSSQLGQGSLFTIKFEPSNKTLTGSFA